MLVRAAARFWEIFSAIQLQNESAARAEGLRRPDGEHCALHCGGMDLDLPLSAFLRREHFLDMSVGVVAWHDHPLSRKGSTRSPRERVRVVLSDPKGLLHGGGDNRQYSECRTIF